MCRQPFAKVLSLNYSELNLANAMKLATEDVDKFSEKAQAVVRKISETISIGQTVAFAIDSSVPLGTDKFPNALLFARELIALWFAQTHKTSLCKAVDIVTARMPTLSHTDWVQQVHQILHESLQKKKCAYNKRDEALQCARATAFHTYSNQYVTDKHCPEAQACLKLQPPKRIRWRDEFTYDEVTKRSKAPLAQTVTWFNGQLYDAET